MYVAGPQVLCLVFSARLRAEVGEDAPMNGWSAAGLSHHSRRSGSGEWRSQKFVQAQRVSFTRLIDGAESCMVRARPGASEGSMRSSPAETRRSRVPAPMCFVFSRNSKCCGSVPRERKCAAHSWLRKQRSGCATRPVDYMHVDICMISLNACCRTLMACTQLGRRQP